MSNSSTDWANLDSQNEKVVGAPAPQDRLAPVPVQVPVPASGSGSESGSKPDAAAARPQGRHHRSPRAAAATAAAAAIAAATACALAVPVSASAAHVQPAAAASWKIIKTVHHSSGPNFTAVTATGRASAWAFETFQASSAKPVAWQLSRSGWRTAPFAGKAGERVTAAGSSAGSDVWAITSNGTTSRALNWNGSSWAVTGKIHADIDAVTVLSSHDVWAFGSPFFPGAGGSWHFNGHSWSHISSGHGLTAGSALPRGDVWAVGGTSVARWNGHTWSRTSVAGLLPADTGLSHSSLVGVYAQSASSIWALGTGGRQDEGGPTVLLHYNGHVWKHVASLLTGNPSQVIPDGSGGLWIPVPSVDGIPFQLLRYSSGHLAPVKLPVSGRKLNVVALAAIPHTAEAFGAGFTHKANDLGFGVVGAILEYER
jgi:hypothetical protein